MYCNEKTTTKTPEIWQTVLCMDLATVATVTVWLMAVWFGFRAVPCFVRDCVICMCMYEHVQRCTLLYACKYMHILYYGLKFMCCWNDSKKTKGISSALRVTVHLSCLFGHSQIFCLQGSASVSLVMPTLRQCGFSMRVPPPRSHTPPPRSF